MTLYKLKLKAEQVASTRGHKIYDWNETGRHSAIAFCENCGRYVQVDSKPLPNGIDIGGPALALQCEDDIRVALYRACKSVVDNWESGDLASAANECREAIDEAQR